MSKKVTLEDLKNFCDKYNSEFSGCCNCPLYIDNICPTWTDEPFCDLDLHKVSSIVSQDISDVACG